MFEKKRRFRFPRRKQTDMQKVINMRRCFVRTSKGHFPNQNVARTVLAPKQRRTNSRIFLLTVFITLIILFLSFLDSLDDNRIIIKSITMPSFRLAFIPFLLSAVGATTPDNVSSRLMIHVSAEFDHVKSCRK